MPSISNAMDSDVQTCGFVGNYRLLLLNSIADVTDVTPHPHRRELFLSWRWWMDTNIKAEKMMNDMTALRSNKFQ